MFGEVRRMFEGGVSGVSLLLACLLALSTLIAGPSAAAAATGEVTTTYWKKGSTEGYELHATAITTSLAETVTLKSGSTVIETLIATDLEGTVYQATVPIAKPALGAVYTISITYPADGPAAETVTVAVTGVLANVPTLTTPIGAVASPASPNLAWAPPSPVPAGFAGYTVSVSDATAPIWSLETATNQTSAAYTGSVLTPGETYSWAVAAVDNYGNKAENRGGSFVLGANFSGKVTGMNGAALAGVWVIPSDAVTKTSYPPAFTEADGSYIYAGLPEGNYNVTFDSPTATAYWKNRLEPQLADAITVTTGAVVSNVNAVLGGWGAISGSLYVPGAKPAAGFQVGLYNLSKVQITSVPAVTVMAAPATSNFANYYLGVIPPGTYYVKFSGQGYTDVFKPVTVTANQTLQTADTSVVLSNGVPVVTGFTAPTSSSSLTVTGISVSASLYGGTVTGYLLTESSTPPLAGAAGWSATPPTSYTFASEGTGKTLYAWAKGSTGLVSAGVMRNVTIILNRTLTVQTAGLGAGSVNSNPTGIACASDSSANCSKSYTGGATVTLAATPSANSLFGGWSGACTGTGSCNVTMDAAKSVTATFNAKPAKIRIDGSTALYYNYGPTLDAITTAGKIVRGKAESFTENVIMNSPVPVKLIGGFTDSAFSLRSATSTSVIDGSLTIRRGTLRVDRLVIR